MSTFQKIVPKPNVKSSVWGFLFAERQRNGNKKINKERTICWACKTKLRLLNNWHSLYLFLLTSSLFLFLYLKKRTNEWQIKRLMDLISEGSGISLCFPPDRTRQKVNEPKVDLKWGLGEGKVGLEPRLEPCWTLLVIGSLNAMGVWWVLLNMGPDTDARL